MNSRVPTRAFRLRVAAIAVCCIVCVCLAGCELPWQGRVNSVQAGDDQNGKSITLHPGQTLLVTLSSTYWSFQGTSNPQVLAPVGAPGVSPGSCPAGSGCGTVSQEFRAVGLGVAQVTAARVSCGEAMRCVGPAGQYELTVQVTAAAGSVVESS